MKRSSPLAKRIDRFFGIPLVFTIGWVRKLLPHSREDFDFNKGVGVFCLAALGDLLILSEHIKAFKEKYPHACITLFCGPDNRSLADIMNIGDIRVVIDQHKPWHSLLKVWNKKFSLVFDCGQWSRWSALLAMLTRSNWIVGFETKSQFRHYGYDEVINHRSDVHEYENFKNLFSSWSVTNNDRPVMMTDSKPKNAGNYVIFHLFPSGQDAYLKEWPAQSWLDLADWLEKKNLKVILTGGSKDQEIFEKNYSSLNQSAVENLIGKMSLSQTMDLIQGAKAVVSVNTGIMHIAAALNKPLIALHGPTNFRRWGPLSDKAVVAEAKIGCSPCLNLGFEYGCDRNDCMKSISSQRVIGELEKMLA